ncbi:MAG: protein kinase [Pseudomonadales bacterium]|nr:protein kinase [Pseudomonadales bacterium]
MSDCNTIDDQLAHYQLQKSLGKGGMGEVMLALDTRLQRQVAIKRLLSNSNPIHQLRLQREAATLAQINHPNVVQLYDILELDDGIALVMEYVDGADLKKYLKEHLVSLQQRLDWLLQISQGLAAIHAQGIIHRDLKAENILISQQGIAKITDLGIAKVQTEETQTELTATGHLVGSFSAFSPEQALGKTLDQRSDLFSFGILAFRLLCGCHPFGDNTNQQQLVQNILNQPPLAAGQLNPDLSQALQQLLQQLLNKDPAQRPATAQLVSEHLQQNIKQLPANASNITGTATLSQVQAQDFSQSQSPGLDYSMTSQEAVLSDYAKRTAYQPTEVNRTQDSSSTTKKRWNKALLLCLFLIIGVSLGGAGWWMWQQNQTPDSLYVAVLPPVINEDSPMSTGQQQLLIDTISDALQQQVISSEGLHLISPRQVSAGHGDYAQRAKALAADVLVEAVLECEAQRCEVTLSRIEAATASQNSDNTAIRSVPHWVVNQQQRWPMVVDKQYLNTAEEFQQRLERIFPQRAVTSQTTPLTEEDYQRFLQHRHAIINEGQDTPEMWQTLWPLQTRYSQYLPYYQLMSYLGNLLYDDSGDERYLQQLSKLFQVGEKTLGAQLPLVIAKLEIAQRVQRFKEAHTLLQQVTLLTEDEVLILNYRGLLANYQSNYLQADQWYRQALILRPSTTLWYRIANNHFHQGDSTAALAALKELRVLDSQDSNAQMLMAQVYLLDGKFPAAIELYQQLITKSPKSQLYSNIGLAYELSGDFQQAEKNFSAAVELSPSNNLWRLNLADSLQLQGKAAAATAHYRQVVKASAARVDDWSSQLNLALARMQLGETSAALQALHRSLRLAGDNAEVLFNAALVYSLAQQWPVALSYIEQSLAQDLSPIWYQLQWFDELCAAETKAFNQLLDNGKAIPSNGKATIEKRCSVR